MKNQNIRNGAKFWLGDNQDRFEVLLEEQKRKKGQVVEQMDPPQRMVRIIEPGIITSCIMPGWCKGFGRPDPSDQKCYAPPCLSTEICKNYANAKMDGRPIRLEYEF